MGTRLGTVLGTQLGTVLGTDLAGGGAAPLIDWPLQMAALYPTMAWWDPTQGYALNGATVSAWVDRISGYSLAQATAGLQPTYSATAINGRPGIGDDNLSRYLQGASALASLMTGTAPCTFMAHAKVRGPLSSGFLPMASFGTIASSTNLVGLFSLQNFAPRYERPAIVAGAIPIAGGSEHTFTSVFTGTTVSLYVDSTAEAGNPFASAGSVPGLDLLTVGGMWRLGALLGSWMGLCGDVVIIPGALTAPQIADGQAWFAARYA